MPDASDARLGSTLGHHRLVRVLGRGGMGVVYLGEHVYLGRRAAVKVLDARWTSNDEAVGRFLREAAAASAISHPNIIEVYDFGQAPDGCTFLVMEHVDGPALRTVLAEQGRLEPTRALRIAKAIVSALHAAHELGIFHRDLKPENVLLAPPRAATSRWLTDEGPRRGFEVVKLVDFGVAKVTRPETASDAGAEHETAFAAVSTRSDSIFGTPEYMAPEVARSARADARSEVYAMGVLLYEMLTGTVPFSGASAAEILFRHLGDAVTPASERAPDARITADLDALMLRALAKAPDDRHQSMADLFEDLRVVSRGLEGRPAAGDRPPPPPPQPRSPLSHQAPRTTLPLGTTGQDLDPELGFEDDEPTLP